ncbi:8558_t:CDS:10 [Ambispora gerdemannii]|uniref:1-phosphatidylinositol-3-phosphate 5-kinase n=1 Tax=Ambispora gerdemannii TaxID=144530 RepID=A0A9N8VY42_9GLOM|nr:8558_t:CDS:10 [Ambispora gerdemannii]
MLVIHPSTTNNSNSNTSNNNSPITPLNLDVKTLTSFDLDKTLEQDNENVVTKLFQRVKNSFSAVSTVTTPPSRPPSALLPDKEKKGFIHGGVTLAPPIVSLAPAFGNSPNLLIESERGAQETHAFLNSESGGGVNGYGIPENMVQRRPALSSPFSSSLTLYDALAPTNNGNSNTLHSYKDVSDTKSIRSSVIGPVSSVGNTNSLKKVIRRLRGEGLNQIYWMSDDICQECYDCQATFTTFRRKHHCRACGQIFCKKCAQHLIPGEKYKLDGPMRVCNFCMKLMQEYGDESDSDLEHALNQRHEFSTAPLPRQIPSSSSIRGNNYYRAPTSTIDHGFSLTPPVPHVPQNWQPRAPSPDTLSINDGIKKMFSAGSSLFVSRSRSNTITEEPIITTLSSSPAPFRRSLTEADKTTPAVNPEAVLDPEIAPFMSDEDQEEHYDSWSNPSNVLNFLSAMHPNDGGGESATLTPAVSEYAGSDDDSWDYNMKSQSKLIQKGDIRHHFGRERAASTRRRSINGVRPPTRHAKRGYMRQINTCVVQPEISINGSPIERPSSPFYARHHRSSSQPIKIEIHHSFLTHMKRLLRQALQEADIDLSEGWEDVIMKLMHKVSENLNPDIRGGDEIDIRHYVKIKKIPGGTPRDSQYVTGVVCTKKLADKKMARALTSPRVLILTFPLEYQRVENQFISLEPVIAQEKKHLENLIQRIADLRPNIVLVEKTVARKALEFLIEHKLTVALNVKTSVIEAVARCTRADILPSMDKFGLNPKLGKCGEFYVKTFEHQLIPGRRKTYLFFENCPKELGCTIVLRGGDIETLEKIKQVTDLMVFVVYNLKLESALMNNQSARAPSHLMDDMCEAKTNKNYNDFNAIEDKVSEALHRYKTKILSVSPFIKFPAPYLLVKMAQTERKLAELTLRKNRGLSLMNNTNINSEYNEENDSDEESQPYPTMNTAGIVRKAEQVIADVEFADILNERDQLTRTWESHILMNNDVSPFAHQNIVVLYSNVCTVTQVPCQGPEIHIIEYYSESDRTLGQYLEEMCYDSSYLCPAKTCDRPLQMHYKSYCHGNARISVVIEQYDCPCPGMEKTILMWSYCTKCQRATPMVPMSENTWKYSFGKYLEQSFYQTELRRIENCPHAIYRDHTHHFFSLQNLAVRFEYQPIDLMEVSVPPMILRTKPEVTIRLKDQDYETCKLKITKYWESVTERIKTFDYGIVQPEKLEVCKQELYDMSSKVFSESKNMLQQLNQTYVNSSPDDTLALNQVRVELHEKVVQWDQSFNEFARQYFQPRMTTRQLKRMIFDKGYPIKELPLSSLEEIFSENKPQIESHELNAVNEKEKELSRTDIEKEKEPEKATSLNITNIIDPKHPQKPKLSQRTVSESKIYSNMNNNRNQQQSEFIKEEINKSAPNSSKRKPSLNKSTDDGDTTKINSVENNRTADLSVDNSREILSSAAAPTNDGLVSDSNPRVSVLTRGLEKAKRENTQERPASKGKKIKKSESESSSERPSNSRQNGRSARIDSKSRIQDSRRSPARAFGSKFAAINNKLKGGRHHSKPTLEVFSNVKEAVKEESDDEYEEDENEKDELSNGLPIPMNKTETYDQTEVKPEYPSIGHEPSDEAFVFHSAIQYLPQDDEISPPESSSRDPGSLKEILPPIVRSLTNLWAERTVANLKPLEYPSLSTEHVFADSNIIVREDEPSSIIAFTLSSKDYLNKLQLEQQTHPSATVTEVFVPENEGHPGTNGSNWDMVDMDEGPENIKDALLRETGMHMKYQFSEGSSQLFCKIFFAEQFDALRRNCGCESTYIQSLARCVKWDSTGGKSGSAFLKTRDDRLVMKQMSRLEMDAFSKFAPAYFEYMSKAFFHELPTVLAKIFGFYRIGYKNEQDGKNMKIDVIVMENLFYERKISKIFDLKGSMRNRHVRSTGKENEVLLDENLLELLHDKPLYLREHSKRILRASLWNDTLFLGKLNVMDYSLLVGIDEGKQELVVGIVDFIRTFTWDKKLESWVKETGILGGGGKEPTIVSPRQYKHRFREAMDRYFLMVPDIWSTHRKTRPGPIQQPKD